MLQLPQDQMQVSAPCSAACTSLMRLPGAGLTCHCRRTASESHHLHAAPAAAPGPAVPAAYWGPVRPPWGRPLSCGSRQGKPSLAC